MDLLRKAHDLAMQKIAGMREELERNPTLKDEIETNIKIYGVPLLSGSYGARWPEDIPKDVRDILFEEMPYKPVEIRIYPEDQECNHWTVEYHLLLWNEEKGFVKALDYERSINGGEKNAGG